MQTHQELQIKETHIHDHAIVRGCQTSDATTQHFDANPMDIYLVCAKQGPVEILASFIPHPIEVTAGEAIFLAFPKSPWSLNLHTAVSASYFVMKLELSTLHKLINPSFDEHQLDGSHRMNVKDLMKLIPIEPALLNCFDQLLYHKIKPPFNALFERAKFLEIFSQLMESSFGKPMESCPVAMSPGIEMKLGKVRRHIIENLDETPDPDALAIEFELPRNTLREGFRFVYGKTIHQFYADYKLDSAMQMLNSGEFLVKEVAFKIGYQNPSHFISAFKKKFGYTPKQFFKREVLS